LKILELVLEQRSGGAEVVEENRSLSAMCVFTPTIFFHSYLMNEIKFFTSTQLDSNQLPTAATTAAGEAFSECGFLAGSAIWPMCSLHMLDVSMITTKLPLRSIPSGLEECLKQDVWR
jgi:hypothetical protein